MGTRNKCRTASLLTPLEGGSWRPPFLTNPSTSGEVHKSCDQQNESLVTPDVSPLSLDRLRRVRYQNLQDNCLSALDTVDVTSGSRGPIVEDVKDVPFGPYTAVVQRPLLQGLNSLSLRLRISPLLENFPQPWPSGTGIFSLTTVRTPEFLEARGL
jgi:hypothetical protein